MCQRRGFVLRQEKTKTSQVLTGQALFPPPDKGLELEGTGNGGRGSKTAASSLISSFPRFSSLSSEWTFRNSSFSMPTALSALLSRLLKNSLDGS